MENVDLFYIFPEQITTIVRADKMVAPEDDGYNQPILAAPLVGQLPYPGDPLMAYMLDRSGNTVYTVDSFKVVAWWLVYRYSPAPYNRGFWDER
jgi:hypothetical protein